MYIHYEVSFVMYFSVSETTEVSTLIKSETRQKSESKVKRPNTKSVYDMRYTPGKNKTSITHP